MSKDAITSDNKAQFKPKTFSGGNPGDLRIEIATERGHTYRNLVENTEQHQALIEQGIAE